MKINSASAIVTGGAHGIGKEITKTLLEHGANVTFFDIDREQGKNTEQKLQEKYGKSHVTFKPCDVTSGEQVKDAINEVKSRNGGLHILCNNAGVLDNENWQKIINTNLIGVIHCTMTGIALMDKTTGGQGGTIVNVASMAGFLHYTFSPVYAATKHGVIGFTRSMVEHNA